MANGGARKGILISLAVVALGLGGFLVYRAVAGAPPGSTESLTQDVTIRCTETGDEWEMSRGRLEQALYLRPGMLDPAEGLPNPETGTPTGFPVNKSRDWDDVIERINAEKRAVMEKNDR